MFLSVVLLLIARVVSQKEKLGAYVIPPLPGNVLPILHQVYLWIEPDPRAHAPLIRGDVNITVEVVNETREIFLNSKNLIIRQVKVDGNKVSWEQVEPYLLNLHSNTLLSKASKHQIWIEFDIIDSNLAVALATIGIKRDSYNDTDGRVRYYVSTQGEEFGAHLYVPCFDDVSMKSQWSLTIKHPKSYKALSNGKLLSRIQTIDGYAISKFEKTPKMSSYLFTFCLSEFKSLTTKAANGIPLTIYMKEPEFTKNGSSGLRYLNETFNFLSSALRPSYPLPKMDVFVAPWEGFSMENWGVITTGGDGMDFGTTQHELAHQWFGNLVTAKSWDQYWLNEGFATYWQLQNFPNEITNIALIRDSIFVRDMLDDALPIVAAKRNLVQAPWSRYGKGALLLCMIDGLIGKQNLWNIMNEYLEANAYKSVVTAQFFASFETFFQDQRGELAKINITRFGYDWTHQAGYPIVSISKNGENYILTQKSSSGNGERWDIPLFIQEDLLCSKNNYSIKVFPKESQNLKLLVSSLPKSPNFNIGYGYYKVELDEGLFDERVELFEDKQTNCDSSAHYRFLVEGTINANKNIRKKSTNLLKKHFPERQEKQFTDESQKLRLGLGIF
ncbi:unnamed protein product, partial [Mesorhabditis belari]|uniref:Membrane alanyl aminopeptidase n=1 Tax=Mesorhabditis belari TaxID=2138241 RepID=A0AAF3EH89_9BILA